MSKNRVALIHLGRSGAGPLFLVEMQKSLQGIGVSSMVISNPHISLNYPDLHIDFPFSTYDSERTLLMNFPKAVIRAIRLRAKLKQASISYVISPMESIYQSLLIPLWLPRNIKYISLIHDGELHPGRFNWLFNIMRKLEYRSADLIVVLSEASRLEVRKATKRKVFLASLPYLDFGEPHAAPSSLQRSRLSMLFFGRLESYKGLRELLVAFRGLDIGDGVGIDLTIAGSGPEVKLKEEFFDPYITWLDDWISDEDIPSLFSSTDLVILPYIQASQSGVIAIAHRYGVPVAITPVGGLKEQMDPEFDIEIESATVEGIGDFLASLSSGEIVLKRGVGVSNDEVAESWRRVVSGPLTELGFFDEKI